MPKAPSPSAPCTVVYTPQRGSASTTAPRPRPHRAAAHIRAATRSSVVGSVLRSLTRCCTKSAATPITLLVRLPSYLAPHHDLSRAHFFIRSLTTDAMPHRPRHLADRRGCPKPGRSQRQADAGVGHGSAEADLHHQISARAMAQVAAPRRGSNVRHLLPQSWKLVLLRNGYVIRDSPVPSPALTTSTEHRRHELVCSPTLALRAFS